MKNALNIYISTILIYKVAGNAEHYATNIYLHILFIERKVFIDKAAVVRDSHSTFSVVSI